MNPTTTTTKEKNNIIHIMLHSYAWFVLLPWNMIYMFQMYSTCVMVIVLPKSEAAISCRIIIIIIFSSSMDWNLTHSLPLCVHCAPYTRRFYFFYFFHFIQMLLFYFANNLSATHKNLNEIEKKCQEIGKAHIFWCLRV